MKRSVRLAAAGLFLLTMMLALGVGAIIAPQVLPLVVALGIPVLTGALIVLLIVT